MTVELRLAGATLVLDDDALEQLAHQVAAALGRNGDDEPQPWIRGAADAAAYLGCSRKRIYDLVSQDRLEHRKDGDPPAPGQADRRPLAFRREWLDEVLEQSVR